MQETVEEEKHILPLIPIFHNLNGTPVLHTESKAPSRYIRAATVCLLSRNPFLMLSTLSMLEPALYYNSSCTLTKVLHFAIGKPMAHHGKFAVKRTAKATLANYGKLSRAKHRGKKQSPASHKRMANNGIFTFPSVKASHGLPRFLAC